MTSTPRVEHRPLFRAFLEQFVEQAFALDPDALESIQPSLHASLGHGAAGFALSLLRVADGRTELLDLADRFVRSALASAARGGLHDPLMEGHDVERSFVHGLAGVLAVEALVAGARGEERRREDAMQRFLAAVRDEGDATELYFGTAGRVTGALHLARASGDGRALEVADELGARLAHLEAGARVPRWASDVDPSFGHGLAGPMSAIASWSMATRRAPPAWFVEVLASLASRLRPGPLKDVPREAAWRVGSLCGGAAGATIAFVRAFELTRDPAHLAIARREARTTGARRWRSNATLCCGAAGSAYALLALHRVDRAGGHHARAAEVLAPLLGPLETEHPLGVMQGYAGVAIAAADVAAADRVAARATAPFLDASSQRVRT